MKLKFTKEQDEIIKTFYSKIGGYGCKDLIPNKTNHQIVMRAGILGCKVEKAVILENRKEGARKVRERKYSKSFEKYCQLSDPKFVYLLGFLWADGYIVKKYNSIVLELAENDMNEVKTILWEDWGLNRYTRNKMPNAKATVSANISNKNLRDFLIENDYMIKSSTNPKKILSLIPKELKNYWWLGFLDGDGTIYFKDKGEKISNYGVGFCSFYNQDWGFAKELENSLNVNFKLNRVVIKNGGGSTIQLHRHEEIIRLCEYIYKNYENDKIGLTRKYNNFLRIKNHSSKHLEAKYKKQSISETLKSP